jgi:PIN domain nuclease of toxin-antitoxin system
VLSSEACQISPAVLLEIDGLFELGRIASDADTVVSGFRRQIELAISETPFLDVVDAARAFAWTHEPFDRLIVANAMTDGARLLTADGHILSHFKDAVW